MTDLNETSMQKRHRRKRKIDLKKRKKERRAKRERAMEPYLEKIQKT